MAMDFGDYSDYSGDYSLDGAPDVGTMTPELPEAPATVTAPATVDVVQSTPGISVSGILSGATSTANDLLKIFGTYSQITNAGESARFNNTLNSAKLDLAKVQSLGAVEIAKTQAAGTVAIENARTKYAVANEMARVSSGGSGTLKNAVSPLLIAAALGIVYLAYKSKGKK